MSEPENKHEKSGNKTIFFAFFLLSNEEKKKQEVIAMEERGRLIVEITYDKSASLSEVKNKLEQAREAPIRHFHILEISTTCYELD